jgi:hypothetical protein
VIHLPFDIAAKLFADDYGILWHAVFRPSDAVQARIDEAMNTLNLVPGEFDATHLRVTHPAFRQQGKDKYGKTGGVELDEGNQFKFEGMDRDIALQGAIYAIQCTQWVAQVHGHLNNNTDPTTIKQKIYFFGDSPDLVKAVLNPNSLLEEDQQGSSLFDIVDELQTMSTTIEIVGREAKIAHLQNRKQETSADAFLSTFVDLYIVSYARCIGLGAGRFGFLAGKISGTTCLTTYLHINERINKDWGLWVVNREVEPCKLPLIL